MRINARLEPAAAQQMEYLITRLGLSASDVLRKGVDLLYKQQAAQAAQPLQFFGKHVGKYRSGQSDLSITYKQEIAQIVQGKFALNAASTSASTDYSKNLRKFAKPRA